MKDKIVIATRESLLALWQAEYVKKRIEDTYPEIAASGDDERRSDSGQVSS